MTFSTFNFAKQRGVSLLFALVTLAALSLAAVAVVRSVGTSGLVIGNLGFKQEATALSERASEAAIEWLDARKTNPILNADIENEGYYATANDNLDPTNRLSVAARSVVDWTGDACASAGAFARCLDSLPGPTVNNNTTRYVITRLCASALASTDAANFCARPVVATIAEGGETGAIDYSLQRSASVTEGGPYYRIVVRTVGARNTVSYTETMVHF